MFSISFESFLKDKMDNSFVDQYKMWTREATTVLIQQYYNNECMWKTTSPFYRNKQKRTEALINIAGTVGKLRPHTTAEDIKNKINGIRTQYVSEINKLILATNRGEPYEPTLWCFNMLTFLKPYTQPKQKCSGVGPPWTSPTTAMKPLGPIISIPPKTQSRTSIDSQGSSDLSIKKCFIKREVDAEADVEIIEDDLLVTDDDYSNHSPFHQEDKSYEEEPLQSTTKETYKESTATPPLQNGIEDHDYHEQKAKSLLSPKGFNTEITVVPKRTTKKRLQDETKTYEDNTDDRPDEKRIKSEEEKPKTSKEDETENRINIFGKFIVSQMRLVTDKILLMRLEHTIQNAIIDAQIKQIEVDEAKNKNEKQN